MSKVGPLESGMKNITQIWKYCGNSRDRTKKRKEKNKTVSNVIIKKKTDKVKKIAAASFLPLPKVRSHLSDISPGPGYYTVY